MSNDVYLFPIGCLSRKCRKTGKRFSSFVYSLFLFIFSLLFFSLFILLFRAIVITSFSSGILGDGPLLSRGLFLPSRPHHRIQTH